MMLALIYPLKRQTILISTFITDYVDMLDSFSRMTLEVILSTALGFETTFQKTNLKT